ncbi:hypothetical protein L6R52_40810 [Myxococcota bacterium]|nr:hypothetical protein [Myxococcota bacterium]
MSTTAAERLAIALSALLASCGAEGGFAGPTDVGFFADGTPLVSDGYGHTRIAVLERGGGVVRALDAGGTADGQLDLPHSIFVGPDDRVYVADRDNARVQVFSRELDHVATWSGSTIGRPFAVTIADDRVFVVDGGDQDPDRPAARVVILGLDGALQGELSMHGTAPGRLSEPHDVVVDRAGRIYVAELGTRRVQRFAPSR